MPNLTPVSYALIALICLMGIFHQWGDGAFPWWRLALVAYIGGMAYEQIRVKATSISVRLISQPRLRLGQPAELILEFHNFNPGSQEVIFAADLPQHLESSRAEKSITVVNGASTRVTISARPLGTGKITWDYLPTRLLGPLHLSRWYRKIPLNAVLEIVPDSLTRSGQTAGTTQSGSLQQQHRGSGQELHHLRNYQPGDPRHTIDWKASAKTARLITRVFGEDQHLDIVLIVDAGRTSRTRIDGLSQLGHYINLSARFAEQAVANEDRIGMIAVTDRPVSVIPPGRGMRAVSRIRDELTRLQTEPVESDMLSAALEVGRFVRHRCLILVLTDIYGADSTGRLNQSVRLWTPQHLPVIVSLTGRELQQLSEQRAGEWLDPYISVAAGNYAEDVHRGMASLRKLGAQTLLSRPRDLERKRLQPISAPEGATPRLNQKPGQPIRASKKRTQ